MKQTDPKPEKPEPRFLSKPHTPSWYDEVRAAYGPNSGSVYQKLNFGKLS